MFLVSISRIERRTPLLDRKKAAQSSLFILARPERFELPTPWFVARYSIQLSYGRVRNRIYDTASRGVRWGLFNAASPLLRGGDYLRL